MTAVWKGEELSFAHLKRDGHWTRVEKSATGQVSVITSRPTNITEKVKFVPTLFGAYVAMPPSSAVEGELWYPGESASYVKSAIKHQNTNLRFSVFAVPSLDEDAPLGDVKAIAELWGFEFIPFWARHGHHSAWGAEGFFRDLNCLPTDRDIEGWVFKNGNLIDFKKWKSEKTIDLIITGYKDGKGKHEFMVGSLICSTVEGYEVANVGGLTDDLREEISCNERKYLGQIIEATYQSVGSRGRLRHPRFKCFRPDKREDRCGASQDPDLQRHWEGV